MMQTKRRSSWLWWLLTFVLVLGIFFRFAHLDRKPYWHDETFTSLRVSGHFVTEAVQKFYTGQAFSVTDLQPYQQASPETSAIDTIKGLAAEEPQHPPLYYVLARLWAQQFGSSIAALRVLPALLSLFALPIGYWLCLELFGSPQVGGMAVALLAISPIYIRFAQESRQYSLWVVLTLLSSVALLRAMRKQRAIDWLFYATTVSLGLYCHLLSCFVLLGHGLYVMLGKCLRFNRSIVPYLISSLIGVATFTPWMWVVAQYQHNLRATTDWMKLPLPLSMLKQMWSAHLGRAFVGWTPPYTHQSLYFALPIAALILYAIYYLCRYAPKSAWLFVLTLMGVTALALVLPDLLWGGKRSSIDRYFLPCYLGIHLAVAYLLVHQLQSSRKRLWKLITIGLIFSSVISGAISAQAATWWNWSEFDVQVAQIINEAPRPLVVSEMPIGTIFALGHRLEPQVHLLLLTDPNRLTIPEGFSDVFVYNPSDRLSAAIGPLGESELVYQFQENTLLISLYRVVQNRRG